MLKERDAEFGLQILNLPGHGLLGDVHLRGGRADVLCTVNLQKIPQLSQLHGIPPSCAVLLLALSFTNDDTRPRGETQEGFFGMKKGGRQTSA